MAWAATWKFIKPCLAGIVAVILATRLAGWLTDLCHRGPRFQGPTTIDLGVQERGGYARGKFVIANTGTADLVISDIRSSCSCAGLEFDGPAGPVGVTTLTIPPGCQRELFVRVAVSGMTGASVTLATTFKTNDSRHPDHTLYTTISEVKAGVTCDPSAWVIGDTRKGQPLTRVVFITDDAPRPRTVDRIEVTPGQDRVSARLLTTGEFEPPASVVGARVVGAIQVTADRKHTGPIDAAVCVYLAEESRSPDAIRVTGKVVDAASITPETLIFPRIRQGQFVYEGTCLCRSLNGQAIEVEQGELPKGVTLTVTDTLHPGSKIPRVSADPQQLSGVKGMNRFVVRMTAKVGDEQCALELPIIYRPAAESRTNLPAPDPRGGP